MNRGETSLAIGRFVVKEQIVDLRQRLIVHAGPGVGDGEPHIAACPQRETLAGRFGVLDGHVLAARKRQRL